MTIVVLSLIFLVLFLPLIVFGQATPPVNTILADCADNKVMKISGGVWVCGDDTSGGGTPSGTVANLDGSAATGVSADYSRGDHEHWITNQTANTVLGGPSSGAAASPSFRALIPDDIPNLDAGKITTGTMATARLGSGTANSTTFLRGDQTYAAPAGGGVAFREFLVCGGTGAAVCHAFTNLGASFVEPASTVSRNNLDLSDFTDFRIVATMAVAAVAGDIQIQCDTDIGFGSPTTLGNLNNPAVNLNVGAWTTIPAGECKTVGGQYIRAGMLNGNATEDPSLRVLRLQVR